MEFLVLVYELVVLIALTSCHLDLTCHAGVPSQGHFRCLSYLEQLLCIRDLGSLHLSS